MNQSVFRTYTCRHLARGNAYEQIVVFLEGGVSGRGRFLGPDETTKRLRMMYYWVSDTGILGKRKSECSYPELNLRPYDY